MSANGEFHVRSFRVVFDLERRLHRVDRWRLPLPYGLPLRSIAYAGTAAATILVLSRLPLTGTLLDALPTPARLVLIPAGVAYALTGINVDGRSAHRTAAALLASGTALRRGTPAARAPAIGTTVYFGAITIAPDGRGSQLRRGRVRGETVALLRRPADLVERRRRLDVRQTGDGWLDPGVEIRFDDSRELVIA